MCLNSIIIILINEYKPIPIHRLSIFLSPLSPYCLSSSCLLSSLRVLLKTLMALIHVFTAPTPHLNQNYQRGTEQIDRRSYDQWSSAPSSEPVSIPPPSHSSSSGSVSCIYLQLIIFAGAGSADQKGASPFVIEWIPNVLPRCHMGELRISFEFGHQQSGQLEHREKTSAAENGGHNSSD